VTVGFRAQARLAVDVLLPYAENEVHHTSRAAGGDCRCRSGSGCGYCGCLRRCRSLRETLPKEAAVASGLEALWTLQKALPTKKVLVIFAHQATMGGTSVAVGLSALADSSTIGRGFSRAHSKEPWVSCSYGACWIHDGRARCGTGWRQNRGCNRTNPVELPDALLGGADRAGLQTLPFEKKPAVFAEQAYIPLAGVAIRGALTRVACCC